MRNKLKKISPKNRRRLVYSVVMVFVPICVLIGLTLGWFVIIEKNEVNSLDFHHNADVYKVYQGEDDDGKPKLDEDGNVIYVPVNGEGLVIENIYPGFIMAFRMELNVGSEDSVVLGYLNDVCPPASQYIKGLPDPLPDPALDLADVLYLQYKKPLEDGTFELVNEKLSDLFVEGTRNIILIEDIMVPAEAEYMLDYRIYMHPDAGNEYQSMRLVVAEAIFRTQH